MSGCGDRVVVGFTRDGKGGAVVVRQASGSELLEGEDLLHHRRAEGGGIVALASVDDLGLLEQVEVIARAEDERAAHFGPVGFHRLLRQVSDVVLVEVASGRGSDGVAGKDAVTDAGEDVRDDVVGQLFTLQATMHLGVEHRLAAALFAGEGDRLDLVLVDRDFLGLGGGGRGQSLVAATAGAGLRVRRGERVVGDRHLVRALKLHVGEGGGELLEGQDRTTEGHQCGIKHGGELQFGGNSVAHDDLE